MLKIVKPYKNDPFVGHLDTPITNSLATISFLKNLPIYRVGTSSLMRGLEIGMAHGYFFVGPFTILGPLRNSEIANLVGLLSSVGLTCILALGIFSYGYVSFNSFNEVEKKEDNLETKIGWNKFGGGFVIGAFGGSLFAFLLLMFL
jgi:photosystem I subunit 11